MEKVAELEFGTISPVVDMCELYDSLYSEDVKIIGSIHDELLPEVSEDPAEEYASMLREIMSRLGSELLYPVPVTSEAEILSSWGRDL